MKKKNGIITLLVLFVLLFGGIYTALFGLDADKTGSAYNIKQGLDLAGGVSITYQVVGEEEPSKEDMADTIYKLQQRVSGYSTESIVYQEGNNRINIEIPGVSDANVILQELGKPGSLTFYNSASEEVLTGTDIKNAEAGAIQDSMGNNQFVVSLTMTEEGTKKFAEATKAAAPTHDIIYIIYDGVVVSAPRVNAEIPDGNAIIEGMSSFEEAEQLASTIRIGGLKLTLEELCSKVVGAQLGETAIRTSILAGIIGFGLIAVFMIAVYLIPGVASVLALLVYVVVIVLLLNGFDITLTLPGIAGIILSVGMAVDANVIIFARIREELATGKTVSSAINIGFKKAMSAIVDSNITTLIAAFVLGIMGTGSVKGFAQTLALGIVVSMFTALFITKIILQAFYALGIKNEKFYGKAKYIPKVNYTSKKNFFFAISLIVIIAGFVFMFMNQKNGNGALNYSLEFKGGTATNVTFNEDLSLEEIDTQVIPVVESVVKGAVQPQKVQGTNEVIIKTNTLSLDQREELNNALVEKFGVDEEKIVAQTISSTISSEMRQDAIVAVVIATICMLIYIWFRFKDIRFAASSVLALLHDVLVVLAFYTFARVSVGSTFIACMLTIVGYSINATIVIFDRIRENQNVMSKKDSLEEMVNLSVNQTLTRSIFTSLTTFIMIAVLYVFGVTSIREFALPLMVGIVCGTYSSVCLTASMWYVFRTKFAKKEK